MQYIFGHQHVADEKVQLSVNGTSIGIHNIQHLVKEWRKTANFPTDNYNYVTSIVGQNITVQPLYLYRMEPHAMEMVAVDVADVYVTMATLGVFVSLG